MVLFKKPLSNKEAGKAHFLCSCCISRKTLVISLHQIYIILGVRVILIYSYLSNNLEVIKIIIVFKLYMFNDVNQVPK